MSASVVDSIPIIDADTHVVEPPDLWTSRISSKWGDQVPHVDWDPVKEEEAWFIGDQRLGAVGAPAMAGWHEHPPFHPRRFTDTDPTSWDATKRAAMMDTFGVQAQILYPNVAVFDAKSIVGMGNAALQLACIEAYNDFLVDFRDEQPGRYIPVSGLPFWDLPATLAEIERSAANGHKGIVFTQDPAYFGLPALTDRHWDPMWASAQEKGLPVNFHIASGDLDLFDLGHPDNGVHANYAAMGVSFFMANARTISQLITGGICHRFPELNFVSVESGIGWIPFALEALDWQWRNCGVHKEHPEYELLPSEYFRRQIYGCFWFERDSALGAIDQLGADNILYETDYPHPTSMSPGPASEAQRPDEYLRQVFGGLDAESMRKILHDNAARIYHVD
jgi:predicted TIM-barrel fold metal-dependent hydrolase